ncbi:D-alanyl-D-alanine carboxypeptidase family protein [Shumkonia mesophila]|uniref:D-alanyl-D-alanine carboxypeptidase family protein n=1 Tax=Shumkonia mesophila TaxID=2838854 RepID=UPI0029341604|nr:D-alanyl-D-alanine carboxypeptidase family protein [Shumkonia mesophila]
MPCVVRKQDLSRHAAGPLGIALAALLMAMQSAHGATLETIAREAFLMDAATGAVLFEKNGDQPMPPASMSKMMTVHMLFERLKEGSISLDDTFSVSERAWRDGGAKSGGSTMFLSPGERVRVEDLIRGIVIQSGNDASIVVAEGLASSEETFAQAMTDRAHKLGLIHSTFRNATGLPDPEHMTTARDLALLAIETIQEFPEYYRYYAEKQFTYNGIRQGNRNPLLYRDTGVDGLKTGHTEASGYGLTASAKRGDRRLVLVVNGLPSMKVRSHESERLLEWGFREFENYKLYAAGDTVADADVWLGQERSVPLRIGKDLVVTLPRKARGEMKVAATFESPLPAPITKGDRLAKLVITAPGVDPIEVPLVAGTDVQRLGIFGRLGAALKYLLWGNTG